MGNKNWSHLLSSEKKGVWPLRRKKNITRGLICISSKLPGWMKTSTCSGSRAHLFQELGMAKKTKFYFASNKVKHSMKHAEIRSTLQLTDTKPHWQNPAHWCRMWSVLWYAKTFRTSTFAFSFLCNSQLLCNFLDWLCNHFGLLTCQFSGYTSKHYNKWVAIALLLFR